MDPTIGTEAQNQTTQPAGRRRGDRSNTVGGVVLVVLGCLFLASNLIPEFDFHDYWPVILIAVGAGLLWNSYRRK